MIKLNRDEIDNLLMELGVRLQFKHVFATITLYGGTVMCVAYEMRGSTFDVDCIYDNQIVTQLAKEIAVERNLESSWLNNAIESIVREDMLKEELTDMTEYGNLRIVIPSERQMLAMKLYSARKGQSNDFEDALSIARKLNLKKETELRDLLQEFFRKDSIRQRNVNHKNTIGRFIAELAEELNK